MPSPTTPFWPPLSSFPWGETECRVEQQPVVGYEVRGSDARFEPDVVAFRGGCAVKRVRPEIAIKRETPFFRHRKAACHRRQKTERIVLQKDERKRFRRTFGSLLFLAKGELAEGQKERENCKFAHDFD